MQDDPKSIDPRDEAQQEGGPDWSPKAPPDLNIILRGGELPADGEEEAPGAEGAAAPRPLKPSVRYSDAEPLKRPEAATAADDPPPFETGGSGINATPIIIGLAVVLLIVVGFFTLPSLLKKDTPATGGGTAGQGSMASSDVEGEAPVGLEPYVIDDFFYGELEEAIKLANERSKSDGYYAYRYGVLEKTDRGISQSISITAYLGGEGADAAAGEGGGQSFRDAMQPYLDGLNAREGVVATLFLRSTGGKEAMGENDRWLVYGKYYFLEHETQIKDILAAINGYKTAEGQYPSSLLTADPGAKTRGNPTFEAGGFGYLPVFKTDSAGNIIMGSGSGIASYNPEECVGYYLLVFLREPDQGLDVMRPDDLKYYIDNISPFPYKPGKALKNAGLNPDGKPDGVACLIKNGEVVDKP
ncbi:hypothetical protein IT575_12920 [bacterium]|nr:hypothetical protein [bacterium]